MKEIKLLSEYLSPLEQTLLERADKPKYPINSLPVLSEKIWGFKKGDLIIVGARPSNGKSALTMQLAYDIANQGHTVLFISLEMSVESILERLFCSVCDVFMKDIVRGGFARNNSIQAKFKAFKNKIEDIDLIITCGIGSTYPELIEMVESIKPDMIVLEKI